MPPTTAIKRTSRKRDAMLQVMQGTKSHPSAQWVYDTLRPQYPDISLGTVYRNIKFFIDNGDIISVGNVNGQERYDTCTVPHTHFICMGCEAVIDLEENGEIAEVCKKTEDTIRGEVFSHSIVFKGLCESCVKNK